MLRPLLLAILLIPLAAHAELRLVLWNPPGYKYAYIVAAREGESRAQAIGRYQSAVSLNPDLRENIFVAPLKIETGALSDFARQPEAPRALLMANKALDMGRAQKYLNDAGQPLKARGIKTYALPLAAELGLSQEEAKEFRAKIAQEFDLLVALGGDDINPTLYHEPPTYARGTISLARDEAEMKMIQDYTKSGRGFFFGICRGSQMLGVSVGCGLVQDIPRELGITGHQTGHHPIFLQSAESNHLAKIFPAETEEIVNTYHHQAVKVIRNDQLRVVATDPRGVVEATELTNGRGIGVQFHPELMRNQMRTKFFDYLAEEARRAYGIRHRVGCQEKFSTLKRKD